MRTRAWIAFLFFVSLILLSFSGSPALAKQQHVVPRIDHRANSEDAYFYKFKFNSYLGAILVGSLDITVDEQFGYAPFNGVPFYVGPEIEFSAFSPGYLVSGLASAWYELRLTGAPRLALVGGVAAGVAFHDVALNQPSPGFCAVGDLGLVQDVDDLVSLRADLRPQIVGTNPGIAILAGVSFRFF